MTYRRRTYLLTFEDPDFEGLEIRARGLSINRATQAMRLASVFDGDRENLSLEDLGKLDTLVRIFAGCPQDCEQVHEELAGQGGGHFTSRIVEWNLPAEHGDGIAPVCYEVFADEDVEFQMAVIMAWLEGTVGTGGGPLEQRSSAGMPPAEVSIPMETLSADPVL